MQLVHRMIISGQYDSRRSIAKTHPGSTLTQHLSTPWFDSQVDRTIIQSIGTYVVLATENISSDLNDMETYYENIIISIGSGSAFR